MAELDGAFDLGAAAYDRSSPPNRSVVSIMAFNNGDGCIGTIRSLPKP